MENFGEHIYHYRTVAGLSQAELAERLEVSRQAISKWETNVAVPELTKIIKMAELFGLSLEQFVLGKEREHAQNLSYQMKDLGERIAQCRAAAGLSQMELAEKLEVSRQSVSKWETNTAVPELSKLVKMAELFVMSLDVFFLEEKPPVDAQTEILMKEVAKETVMEVKKEVKKYSAVKTGFGIVFMTVGILFALFCLAYGAWIDAIAFLIPSVMSAVFCFKQFRFAALWCLETWYGYILLWCAHGMSITPHDIWRTGLLLSVHGINPMRVVIAWVLFFGVVFFIALTVFVYRKHTFVFSRQKQIVYGVGVLLAFPLKRLLAALYPKILYVLVGVSDFSEFVHVLNQSRILRLVWVVLDFVVDMGAYAAFTVFLVPTFYTIVSFLKRKRAEKTEKGLR